MYNKEQNGSVNKKRLTRSLCIVNAKAAVKATKSAVEDALKLAARDVFQKLHDTLLDSFSLEVTRIFGKQMAKENFPEQLILELAGGVVIKPLPDYMAIVCVFCQLRKQPPPLCLDFHSSKYFLPPLLTLSIHQRLIEQHFRLH